MNELPSKDEMQSLIDKEIESMEPNLKKYAHSVLVPLKEKALKWEYGNNEEYKAWVFADFGERNIGAAYCLGGHGKSGDTWGLIFTNDDYFGMDAGWYSSFKEMLNDGWYKKKLNKFVQLTFWSTLLFVYGLRPSSHKNPLQPKRS